MEEAVELLSRWNPKCSLDQEIVEHLLRNDPEISMDRRFVDVSIEAKERSLIERESVEDLSRSYRAWRKGVLQGGKTQGDKSNKQATQPKIKSTC